MLPTFMLDCCFAADRADNGETASLNRVKRGGPCTKRRNLEAEYLGELLLLLLTGLKQHLSIGN